MTHVSIPAAPYLRVETSLIEYDITDITWKYYTLSIKGFGLHADVEDYLIQNEVDFRKDFNVVHSIRCSVDEVGNQTEAEIYRSQGSLFGSITMPQADAVMFVLAFSDWRP